MPLRPAFNVALANVTENTFQTYLTEWFCTFLLSPQAEWVALNYVPFAERSLEVVVDLYHKTACHKAVINEKVLQNIIKVFSHDYLADNNTRVVGI